MLNIFQRLLRLPDTSSFSDFAHNVSVISVPEVSSLLEVVVLKESFYRFDVCLLPDGSLSFLTGPNHTFPLANNGIFISIELSLLLSSLRPNIQSFSPPPPPRVMVENVYLCPSIGYIVARWKDDHCMFV